jgi:methylmalonyl-CoA/ethylmalonyl-CoA epimerase
MKIARVDHIGIVSADTSAAKMFYGTLLGLEVESEEIFNDRDRLTFFAVGDTRIEVCTSLDDASETASALREHGEHIDHIALEVEDIDAAIVELADAGVSVSAPGVMRGAAGSRVAILSPSATCGVLVELVEQPSAALCDAPDASS